MCELRRALDEVSHNIISDYLQRAKQTTRYLWELVQGLIDDSPEAWLLLDDSVQDKLTGSTKCQCRNARSQRNHLACCYHAWLSLKVHAKALNKTICQVCTDLFIEYLRAELRNPRIPAFQVV